VVLLVTPLTFDNSELNAIVDALEARVTWLMYSARLQHESVSRVSEGGKGVEVLLAQAETSEKNAARSLVVSEKIRAYLSQSSKGKRA
jgi:hypothetical protein